MFSLSLTGVSTRSHSFGLMWLFLAPQQLPASVQAVISTLVLFCVLFVSCYTTCLSCVYICALTETLLAVVSTQQQQSFHDVNTCPTVDTHISLCPKI